MFVCVCKAVSEREVRECIAGGATSRAAVTKACEAGGVCGACHQQIEEMVEDHLIAASKLNRGRAA
jgi:bacterioferritin-associated ferredoxin